MYEKKVSKFFFFFVDLIFIEICTLQEIKINQIGSFSLWHRRDVVHIFF